MCVARMDLNKEDNLNMAIYTLVLSEEHEFSSRDLVNKIEEYQDIDEEKVENQVSSLLKCWVKAGIIQKHIDTFSVI